jgi:hypothetical protein
MDASPHAPIRALLDETRPTVDKQHRIAFTPTPPISERRKTACYKKA